MGERITLAGEGSLFWQKGPNLKPEWLGCHELGDITEPRGDVTLLYNQTDNPNEWKVDGDYTGEPGAVTTSITTDVRNVKDKLDESRCPGALYVKSSDCGKRSTLQAFDVLFALRYPNITQRTLTKLSARVPENQDRSTKTYDISARSLEDHYKFKGVRLAVSEETEGLNDIVSYHPGRCAGNCGEMIDPGDRLAAVGDTLSGSPINTADVIISTDAGADWAPTDSDPFGAAEVIASVDYVEIDEDTTRIIVARGTTDALNPAEIAYTDDYGDSWTHVNVGAVDGQYATGPKSLYVINYYSIWLVTTGGYIYESQDGAASWTARSSGDVTTENLNGIEFADDKYGYAVGNNNAILFTSDSGAIWSEVTGHADQAAANILSLGVHDKNRVWLAYSDGQLYYTHNGGDDWYERTFPDGGSGSVVHMDWLDVWNGMIVHNTAAGLGRVLVTFDGGYTWIAVSIPTNSGLTSGIMVTETLIYVVGEIHDGTAYIAKLTGG